MARATRGSRPRSGLAVTVLTSEEDTSAFAPRLRAVVDAGCGGVVCSMHEVAAVKAARADLVTAVPGVRLASDDRNDQRRLGTPEAVAAAGADILVVGRAVTAAADPARVAARDARGRDRRRGGLARLVGARKPSRSCGAGEGRYAGPPLRRACTNAHRVGGIGRTRNVSVHSLHVQAHIASERK